MFIIFILEIATTEKSDYNNLQAQIMALSGLESDPGNNSSIGSDSIISTLDLLKSCNSYLTNVICFIFSYIYQTWRCKDYNN